MKPSAYSSSQLDKIIQSAAGLWLDIADIAVDPNGKCEECKLLDDISRKCKIELALREAKESGRA